MNKVGRFLGAIAAGVLCFAGFHVFIRSIDVGLLLTLLDLWIGGSIGLGVYIGLRDGWLVDKPRQATDEHGGHQT